MPQHTRQQAGYTIMELITAMGIILLLLFLTSQLFQSTSLVAQRGMQTSKVIATARILNEQIAADAGKMVGPTRSTSSVGGFLIITQERLTNGGTGVKMIDPQTIAETSVEQIRSDQLTFIRNATGLRSTTPQNSSTYRSNLTGVSGDVAKVWYGHAKRTEPDGTRTGTTANHYLGGSSAGIDRIANNLIFGRQAMLFNPTDRSTGNKISTATGSYIHATSSDFNSPVSGSTGAPSPAATYMGLTDVTIQNYGSGIGTSAIPGTLLYNLTDTTALTAANHNTNYLAQQYPSNADRLHVNPKPNPGDTSYAPWSFAQTHAILAQSCSEIEITFAADLNGDGQIDTQFGGQSPTTGAPIWWYDGITQPNLGVTPAGQWENQATIPQPYFSGSSNANKKVYIFRVDDGTAYNSTAGGTQAHSYWPYLIRIRYRLHDTRGRLTSNDPNSLRDRIDNDGDGITDLVNGDNDEDKISGRWVENIIKVNRP